MAQCEVRFRRLTLPPTIDAMEPLTVYGVYIVETQPPQGELPVSGIC